MQTIVAPMSAVVFALHRANKRIFWFW